MNPSDLVIFVNVIEKNGFTAAARALNVPKSTVSRRLARLEAELDQRLMHRTTRQWALTDAGQLLYQHAVGIVARLDDAQVALQTMQQEPRGHLQVTAPVDMGPRLVPLLADFLAANPEITLNLDLSNRYVDLIGEGFDVAIRASRALTDSKLMARRLATSHRILVASSDFLSRHGEPRRVHDLSAMPCILFPRWQKEATWQLHHEGREVSVVVRGVMGLNHLDAVKQAAMAGLGIASVPQEFCVDELASGRLREVLPGSGTSGATLWVVYPEMRFPSPKIRHFVDHLVTRFV